MALSATWMSEFFEKAKGHEGHTCFPAGLPLFSFLSCLRSFIAPNLKGTLLKNEPEFQLQRNLAHSENPCLQSGAIHRSANGDPKSGCRARSLSTAVCDLEYSGIISFCFDLPSPVSGRIQVRLILGSFPGRLAKNGRFQSAYFCQSITCIRKDSLKIKGKCLWTQMANVLHNSWYRELLGRDSL